jgi:hypothetical protein
MLTDKGLAPPRDGDDMAPSTAASTIALDKEKLDITDIGGTTSDGEGSEVTPAAIYPEGVRMVFIVIALVLSIFLVSLDMVGILSIIIYIRNLSFLTSVRRPLWPRPSPRLQTNSQASTMYLGTAPPSSCASPRFSRHVSLSEEFPTIYG